MRIGVLLLATLLLPVFPTAVCAETPQWNQWRGPTRDSKLPAANWPDALKGRLNLAWERSHSPSYSGPIVHDGLVFTTETIEKTTERVTAYDLENGEVSWQVEWPGAMAVPFFAASNGDWIRSTPAVADGRLVVLGMRDVMVCLDAKTGRELWRVDFPGDLGTPLPSFGAVCSPLIDKGTIYVQTGGAVVALSLEDGGIVWEALSNAPGMMSSGAFSSPVIAEIAGQRQLVVQTRQQLCGVELETGKVLWKQPIEAFRGMNILTPLVTGDRIFTSAHSGRAQLFEISRKDDKWQVDEVWMRNTQAYMSSPVLMGDSIYMHLKNQRVTALDLGDGSPLWTSSPFGKYWSMVASGDKILALDNGGDLMLVKASPSELTIVDKMKVADDSWAHLAVQGDNVIVRDLRGLKVYRWK